jgi:hypothetical protein
LGVTANAARKPGCPSDFLPEYPDQAAKFCRLGATDTEIADFFGKDERTVNRWKIDHPEFCQALKDSKLVSDMEVADRLHHRAVGFEYEEAQAHNLKTVEYKDGKPAVRDGGSAIDPAKFTAGRCSVALRAHDILEVCDAASEPIDPHDYKRIAWSQDFTKRLKLWSLSCLAS